MSHDLFEHLKSTLAAQLPDARVGKASAFAEIAEAHACATHIGYRFAITYAWHCLACECADASQENRDEKLRYEINMPADILHSGESLMPTIRKRIRSGEAPGRWTGSIVPNDTDFVHDWLKLNESRQEDAHKTDTSVSWAWELLFDAITMRRDFDASLSMVNALLAAHTTEWQLVSLGCGAIEDMLKTFGKQAVDAFVPRLRNEPALAKAVACVWISDVTDPDEKIRKHWNRSIAEHGVPVAVDTSDTMHLPGPHAPL